MAPAPSCFHLDRPGGGQCFAIHHDAAGARPAGTVLFVHAFGEEMNKSRRMAALQSRAMAEAGFAVLQIDLLGCGDSSGDLGDAGWDDWLDDVLGAWRWLAQRHPQVPRWLWGHRAGALVATEAARRLDEPAGFLFWQPATAGKLVLQQFLRLKLAAGLADGSAGRGVVERLRQQLAAGEPVEVAGYLLGPALAQGLEQASLAPPAHARAAAFFELYTGEAEPPPSPALAQQAERWRAAGATVATRQVPGPAFWQTTEIEDAPALVPATLEALRAAQDRSA